MSGIWLVSYVCLWILMVSSILVILALARQVGLLHSRLSPTGALMANAGPQVGERVPEFGGLDLEDRLVQIGGVRDKDLLVVFVSAICSSCEGLAPALKSLQKSEAATLDFLLVGLMGDRERNKEFVKRHNLNSIPLMLSRDIGIKYKISSPPYGLLVDKFGTLRAKGVVNHLEHLESLINAAELFKPDTRSRVSLTEETLFHSSE